MRVVLIMAKEGSIGLPGKNIWEIKGKTLLGWTIEDARRSKLVDAVYVSTNGEKTASIAAEAGARIIKRENELAKNEQALQAIDHAVMAIKEEHNDLDIIAMPQCVVPFRAPDIFDRCIRFLSENDDYDSVVTIRQIECIPEAIMGEKNGSLVPYFPETQKTVDASRQSSNGYEIDHAIECFRYSTWLNRENGIRPWTYLGKKIKGINQRSHNPNCFVDVHTLNDIKWLEFLIDNLGFEGMKRSE